MKFRLMLWTLLAALLLQKSLSAQEADYLPRAVFYSDGRITRFEKMPLTIRLDPLPESLADSGYDADFRRAVQLWTDATGGEITCKLLSSEDSSESVDIPVHWQTKLSDRPDGHLGRTLLIRATPATFPLRSGRSFRVRMELGVYDRRYGRRISNEEMLSQCLHELGHALGLWGHSDAAEDVMSPATEARAPTPRDVETLKRVYALPPNTPFHDAALPILAAEIAANPENADAYFLYGSLLLDIKEYDKAIDSLLKALELNVFHADAGQKLVMAYMASGQTDEAVRRLEETGTADAAFYNTVAGTLYDKGKEDEAVAALEKGLRQNPQDGTLRRNLARLCVQQATRLAGSGEYSRAETLLRRAIELAPDELIYRAQLGVVLNRMARDEEAIAVYREALERDPDFAPAKDNLAKTYNNLAVGKAGREEWEAALANFDNALRLDPTLDSAKSNRAAVLWNWAQSLEQSDPTRSLFVFEKYLEANPNSAEAHVRVGLIYARRKDFERALPALTRAQELDPNAEPIRKNLVSVLHLYGSTLDRSGRSAAALEPLRKAVELNPDDLDLYRTLGQTYSHLGRREEAARTYAEILKRDPEDSWAQTAVVNLFLSAGNDAVKRGDMKRAIAEFENVPDKGRTAAVYALLGYLYLSTNQPIKASDALGKSLTLDPNEKTARANFELAKKRLAEEAKKKDTPEIRYALVRRQAYELYAAIARRPRKAEMEQFAQLVAAAPNDPPTVAALQACALLIARDATPRYPEDAKRVAEKAYSLNEENGELKSWLAGLVPTGGKP